MIVSCIHLYLLKKDMQEKTNSKPSKLQARSDANEATHKRQVSVEWVHFQGGGGHFVNASFISGVYFI